MTLRRHIEPREAISGPPARPTVYIESTVVSYCTARTGRNPGMALHQRITREWWDRVLPSMQPYVSPFVLDEIARGDPAAAARRLKLVDKFPVLEVVAEVNALAERYFRAIDIPRKAQADAYHLALAVWHGMDYMVSWNCTHIASGRVQRIVEDINAFLGIRSPVICTPETLMEV